MEREYERRLKSKEDQVDLIYEVLQISKTVGSLKNSLI